MSVLARPFLLGIAALGLALALIWSSPGSASAQAGTITYGSIPAGGGFGLIVFGGGTLEELVTASGCPAATATFWATSGGQFIAYIPGTSVAAVNEAFIGLFPEGIPANTPLVGRCV
jgi:hypothetical protein